jgi:2-keto-4-pentenoate hydratase/2-oxohepta-3-ene-1,7-dioic acid hydratase in catechol pathway
MRLARIQTADGPRPVVQDGSRWSVVEDLFATSPARTGEQHPVVGSRLLAPVEPRVVLGMAHNSGPADRRLPPQAFMKSARTVIGPEEPIQLDPRVGRVVVEGELVAVIGRTCRDLTLEAVPGSILGWTIANDVTAVDQIPLDDKFTQVKNGDGFTPLGPWIETDLDPRAVDIEVRVDGAVLARSSTAGLARDVGEQLVYLTSFLTLGPGDVVLTGAPGTSAPVAPGQSTAITLAGIGTLTNPAVLRPNAP